MTAEIVKPWFTIRSRIRTIILIIWVQVFYHCWDWTKVRIQEEFPGGVAAKALVLSTLRPGFSIPAK